MTSAGSLPVGTGLARERARLCLRATSGLGWLTKNVNRFSAWSDGQLTDAGLKTLAELAILYAHLESCASLAAELPLGASLPIWRAFLIEHCEAASYAEVIRKRPQQAFYLMLPYLTLRTTGYRSSYYEDALQRLRRWGLPQAAEVVPYRFLDQQYFIWKSGWMKREPNWLRLYRDTTLSRLRSSVYIDHDAAYSITHTLFYLTDLGNRRPPLDEADVVRVVAVIENLLVHYWRLSHWDLVGELLVNLECLEGRSSIFYAGAARAFLGAWRRDGAVPPGPDEAVESRLAHEADREGPIFRLCYHTTLVGVLYCSIALARISYANDAAVRP